MHSLEGGVEDLIEGDCPVVEDGGTMTPVSEGGSCFELTVNQNSDVSAFILDTSGMAGFAAYTAHSPYEFEADEHYLKDSQETTLNTSLKKAEAATATTTTTVMTTATTTVMTTVMTTARECVTTPQPTRTTSQRKKSAQMQATFGPRRMTITVRECVTTPQPTRTTSQQKQTVLQQAMSDGPRGS